MAWGMKIILCGVAALICFGVSAANAVTWRFDFTSSRGGGFFEVDGSNFVIPLSAGNSTSFDITAADLIINSGSFLGQFHYSASDVFSTDCTPAECAAAFKVGPVTIPQKGTYSAVYIQLNFEVMWVPWVTTDQKTIQLWFHTDPYGPGIAWNDTAMAERSVLTDPTPLPAALPLFATGLGVLGLLGWRRKRKTCSGLM